MSQGNSPGTKKTDRSAKAQNLSCPFGEKKNFFHLPEFEPRHTGSLESKRNCEELLKQIRSKTNAAAIK
jgi:hypothetical protein